MSADRADYGVGPGVGATVGAATGFGGAGGGTVKPGMYTDFRPKSGIAELTDCATPQARGRLMTSQ